jgi:hypothetical protein
MKIHHMKSATRTALVAGLALLALSGVATASASAALPEIVNKEGKALIKNKFAADILGQERAVWFKTIAKEYVGVFCKTAAASGDFSGLKAGEVTFTLKGCLDGGAEYCTGTGERHAELVISFALAPVYINKASKELALLFTLHEASFECGAVPTTISGDFLVPIRKENVNKLLGVGKPLWLLAEATGGEQSPKAYENEKGEKIEAFVNVNFDSGNKKAGAIFEAEGLFEEEVEFKG